MSWWELWDWAQSSDAVDCAFRGALCWRLDKPGWCSHSAYTSLYIFMASMVFPEPQSPPLLYEENNP